MPIFHSSPLPATTGRPETSDVTILAAEQSCHEFLAGAAGSASSSTAVSSSAAGVVDGYSYQLEYEAPDWFESPNQVAGDCVSGSGFGVKALVTVKATVASGAVLAMPPSAASKPMRSLAGLVQLTEQVQDSVVPGAAGSSIEAVVDI